MKKYILQFLILFGGIALFLALFSWVMMDRHAWFNTFGLEEFYLLLAGIALLLALLITIFLLLVEQKKQLDRIEEKLSKKEK